MDRRAETDSGEDEEISWVQAYEGECGDLIWKLLCSL